MRQLGEGVLAVPSSWHDATVNVYTAEPAGARGITVTVNRDRLPPGSTLDDYVEAQSRILAAQLKKFQLLGRERLLVAGRLAHILEFTWLSRDAGDVHQLLMTLVLDQKVLNFAGTSPGRMDDRQRAELRAVLESFRPTPQLPE